MMSREVSPIKENYILKDLVTVAILPKPWSFTKDYQSGFFVLKPN